MFSIKKRILNPAAQTRHLNVFCSAVPQIHGDPSLQLNADLEHAALRDIDDYLYALGKSLAEFPNMPVPPPPEAAQTFSKQEQEELGYDRTALAAAVGRDLPRLNEGQRAVFNSVVAAVRGEEVRPSLSILFRQSAVS